MKIFHTADWHIGKLVNAVHMTGDQAIVLDQLCSMIREHRPDAVVIAGDLYDRSVPPVEAVELLDRTLHAIVHDLDTPVIALAGNHDSNERVGFASALLAESGLHMSGTLTKEIPPVVLSDAHGPVHFFPIPYADTPVVRALFDDESIKTADDAMRRILSAVTGRMDPGVRSVAVAHGYVVKSGELPETSESERPLSLGGTESIDASLFEPFTYTALGHLHSPQRAGSERIRYAGSLLKYSLSEVSQKKGVTVVDIAADGSVETSFLQFRPRRDMRIIRGELAELISQKSVSSGNPEDYVFAVLTDKGELLDPMARLRSVYPNVLGMEREARAAGSGSSASAGFKGRTALGLFEDFAASMTGETCPPELIEGMKPIIEAAEKGAEQ